MNSVVGGMRLRDSYVLRVQPDGEHNFFVNTYSDQAADGSPLAFGDVIHFTKGHLQALFQVDDPAAPSAAVQQMPAPALSEYVHSQMFWMVKGDHVFVIQSISLKTEQWENYLKWLLSTQTTLLPAHLPVILAAKFSREMDGGDLDDIQEIVVGGIAQTAPEAPPQLDSAQPEEQIVERDVTTAGAVDAGRQTSWAQAKQILSTLLGGDANVGRFMAAVPPDADLRVEVHIGYKTRKRQVSRVALRQLETGLRNLPDSQLQVRSKGASRAADGSIRLHYNAGVRLIKALDGNVEKIGSLIDPADALRAMFEAYTNFLANGKITDEE
ncbi:MAG: hypothetical protein ACRYGO_01445 [Janthinobacterium lividum]